jgi:excinuclease ABC subunit C
VQIFTPLVLSPHAAEFPDQLAKIPPGSAVYALRAGGKLAHIAWSANLQRRLHRLFVSYHTAGASALQAVRAKVEAVECWPATSRLEIWLLLYQLFRIHYPGDYLRRLRLRMPWFLTWTRDCFPRLRVTNRISRNGICVGPFPSREAAQRYEAEVLNLFQIRRCTEVLAPNPEHPGCIYGEMNQCMRPCQCAVSALEYASEVERASEFLESNGKGVIAGLTAARERASEAMDFEQAAQLHKRIEKIQAARSVRDEIVRQAASFSGVALVPGREHGEFLLWPMLGAIWREPVRARFSEHAAAKSLDQQIRELLSEALSQTGEAASQLEHLAVFVRWYFSSWRDGEWFPFTELPDLDYRRLVREISRRMRSGGPASGLTG